MAAIHITMIHVGLNQILTTGILVRGFVTGIHVTVDSRQSGSFPNWVILRRPSTVPLLPSSTVQTQTCPQWMSKVFGGQGLCLKRVALFTFGLLMILFPSNKCQRNGGPGIQPLAKDVVTARPNAL
jgi:hypothetical protein